MTRQHFRAIAEAIRTTYEYAETDAERDAIASIARHIASALARFNGRFDRDRFLTACGCG
jgi:hypothetical protein